VNRLNGAVLFGIVAAAAPDSGYIELPQTALGVSAAFLAALALVLFSVQHRRGGVPRRELPSRWNEAS